MDPFQSFLSSLSPSRAKSPTPAHTTGKSRFRRHPPPELSLHATPKLSSSVSSSNLLSPNPPNALAANPNASTSNLRALSPSPERGKVKPGKGKRLGMLAQPLAFHLPRARSPKPAKAPRPMPSISQSAAEADADAPKTPQTAHTVSTNSSMSPNPTQQTIEIPVTGSSTSLAAPSVPARSPLRGTPRSAGSFSSLLNTYPEQPNASHSDSTLGLGLTPNGEGVPAPAAKETGWTQLLQPADPPSPSIYSPIQSIFPPRESLEREHKVRRSASLRADRLGAERSTSNSVGKGPRLEALRMPSTRARSASVSSPMLYEEGAEVDANKGANSRGADVIPGRRSVDAYQPNMDSKPGRTLSPRPSVSRRTTTSRSSSVAHDSVPRPSTSTMNLATIRDSAITIPSEKDLPPPPPPKLHVRMQSEFTLGPEFALIANESNHSVPARGVTTVDRGLSPTASAESGESSGFETAASHTNNTSLDTSIPGLGGARSGSSSTRPGTSLSLNHPTRPSTSASTTRPNHSMVITLPLPPSTPSHAPTSESASTRTSTSQVSLLVDSPERVYGYKPDLDRDGSTPLPGILTGPSQASLPVPDTATSSPSPTTSTVPKTSKRTHALLELLSSERAYASDLALIRDIYLPLAKGLPSSYPLPPSVGSLMFPGNPGPSTSRLIKKGTNGSTAGRKKGSNGKKSSNETPAPVPTSPTSPNAPPMTAQDVKVIFGNIEELAAFADEFSEKLEAALGNVVPGGTGEDHVGELFCELAPRMAPMYLTYITRHPAAVARYTALSTNPSPAMMQYLATTRAMTSSITHAWDIPSLIIKPLQRLLKYPLILQTIHENTPITMGHKDRATLFLAKDKMEAVARQVNEGQRRWEVVKSVLESGKSPPSGPKGRIKPFKGRASTNGAEAQADLVKLENRVKEGEAAANAMAEQVISWANELTAGAVRLLGWSRAFARVVDLDVLLGGDPQGGSEAVRAFTTVSQSLEDLSKELAAVIKEELVPQLQRLSKTTREPLLLLAHMQTLASAHHNLVNAPYSKSRPAALLEASQAYLALAAQLREELPRYVDMFERAFGIIVLRLSGWQARYFQEAERRWKEFWLALNVEESEVGAGESAAVETVRIWWSRWESTARQTGGMSIVTPNKRVYGGGQGNGGGGASSRQQQSQLPSTPSSDSASWDYLPPYHSKPSALSLGDQQSAASASSSAKGHSRAISTDFAPPVPRNRSGASLAPRVKSEPSPEHLLPKGKKSQRSSNLRRVTDTLFGGTPGELTGSNSPARDSAHSSSSRIQQPVLYAAAAIHPFNPETDVTHLGLPFLSLRIGDTLEILVEAGHPSEHSNLPIPYDDAPDCMLAARNEDGVEGWALASYLMPLT